MSLASGPRRTKRKRTKAEDASLTVGDNDFYPTPPDCVDVLANHVLRLELPVASDLPWFDPAVGAGAIPHGMALKGIGPWTGRDIAVDAQRWCDRGLLDLQEQLGGPARPGPLCLEVTAGDSTVLGLPAANTAQNPPFDLLEVLVDRAVSNARANGAIAAILTSGQWMDEGEGRRAKAWRPDHQLRMCWRNSFTGKGTPSVTHCWNVWLPVRRKRSTEMFFVTARPHVPAWRWALHRAMLGVIEIQPSLF